eukprot:CAMPEP_0197021002 /NCGR_PEP_ID=MMETSP1384-20130603/1890_1 /TAXON_ID=29189 /ORGANISM="Ammonia sp." /LENGTH=38 /DNA_ID= /DNA_START= /DNA_END= /DNA_ORIENTATION=
MPQCEAELVNAVLPPQMPSEPTSFHAFELNSNWTIALV